MTYQEFIQKQTEFNVLEQPYLDQARKIFNNHEVNKRHRNLGKVEFYTDFVSIEILDYDYNHYEDWSIPADIFMDDAKVKEFFEAKKQAKIEEEKQQAIRINSYREKTEREQYEALKKKFETNT